MKVTLGKKEFEQMVELWAYKNFVEKVVTSASIDDGEVVITVDDEGAAPGFEEFRKDD